MNDEIEDRIRRHAYLLWKAAGSPEGQSEAFWLQARESELGLSQPTEPALDESIEESFPASDPPGTGDFA